MSDPFEGLLRSTLTDIAEEAPTVQDSLTRAERRVRNRRRNTVAAGAAGILAVLVIGAPFAYAGRGDDPVISPQPGTSAPQPDRTEPVPAPPGLASPVPVGPDGRRMPDGADPTRPGAPSPVPVGPEGTSPPDSAVPSPVPLGPEGTSPPGGAMPSPSPIRR
ncbi:MULTISPECIES: hypothetical protein [Micromonospora]|uniref:hypothetical protein n=1 Tax=Micromonospora TaxID=1873 RepID=UPI0001C44FA3|nr:MULTISPECIES: hypothetical protein [Micromonospora]ADU09048.1 hypothetical protein ML5_3534 [Micromonospora sp. L5]MBC9006487.1 hypothetical protein [Micromonospora aurantiaca]SCL42405.1 hypothetical protein GA0070615_5556 [Micromonospora aurantiaca]